MKALSFVTSNYSKFKEAESILGIDLTRIDFNLPEIQDLDIRKVVEEKAVRAYSIVGGPVLVEDVGLYIEDLGGLPGVFIKWFIQAMSLERLCKLVDKENRKAVTKAALAITNGRELFTFIGKLEGNIALYPRGRKGFGWDSIFIPRGFDLTFAELGEEIKNKISHRRKALNQLKSFLQENKYFLA